MPRIYSIGKYLDQPILTAKINKNVPHMLALGSGAVLAKNIYNAPEGKKTKMGFKSAIILSATALSAIAAPRIAAKITGRKMSATLAQVMEENANIVDNYLKTNPDTPLRGILEKTKTNLLSLNEIKELFKTNKELANKLIPPPDNITAKDIFREIGYLSIYGAVPVAGGILGGISADAMTEKQWKRRVPNKINEGIYQYLANIFLCNIGAGVALGFLEKLNIKSKTARCIGMIGGILLTGVIGGSVMANYIGNKIINPVIMKNHKEEKRTPEILDLSLHTDDIATVSLLSGLKWIEPSLPLLYSVSGYRAAIGYRNAPNKNKK